MIQALVTYVIVAVAAAWVLWSVLLPARLRRALRRALARRVDPAATGPEADGCGGCPGCARRD